MGGHLLLVFYGAFWHRLFVLVGLLVCLGRLEGQNSVPAIEDALRQRELAVSQLETKWGWLRKCPPELGELSQKTTWVLQGLGDRFAFWGDLPLVGNPAQSHPYQAVLYDNGCVWPRRLEGHGWGGIAWPIISGWALGEPLLYVVLAGRNPMKWVTDVRITSRPGSTQVVISGKPNSQDAPYQVYQAEPPVRFFIDTTKGGAVSRVHFTRVGVPMSGEIRVDRWTRYRGIWLPAHIVLTDGAGGCEQRLTLLEARDSPAKHPEWASLSGIVDDMRLGVSELKGVPYKWQGRLPDLVEVKRTRERAEAKAVSSTRGVWIYRLIPPLLLILIGALWYWRLRVKKVA